MGSWTCGLKVEGKLSEVVAGLWFFVFIGLVQKSKVVAINNMPDHVHILVGLRPDLALSDLVRDIKANSSGFINTRRWVRGRFNWQEGFGAFSYSRSQLGKVIRYIGNQQKHHAKKTFGEEYLELLEKFEVEYDGRYIFKTIEK